MDNKENNQETQAQPERKKISLQEAMKQKIASKNQAASGNKAYANTSKVGQGAKHQTIHKKSTTRMKRGV